MKLQRLPPASTVWRHLKRKLTNLMNLPNGLTGLETKSSARTHTHTHISRTLQTLQPNIPPSPPLAGLPRLCCLLESLQDSPGLCGNKMDVNNQLLVRPSFASLLNSTHIHTHTHTQPLIVSLCLCLNIRMSIPKNVTHQPLVVPGRSY